MSELRVGSERARNNGQGVNTYISLDGYRFFVDNSSSAVRQKQSAAPLNNRGIRPEELEEEFVEEIVEEEPKSIEQQLLDSIAGDREPQDLIMPENFNNADRSKRIIRGAQVLARLAFSSIVILGALLPAIMAFGLSTPILLNIILPLIITKVLVGVIGTGVAYFKKKALKAEAPLNQYNLQKVFSTSKIAKVLKVCAIVLVTLAVASSFIFVGSYGGLFMLPTAISSITTVLPTLYVLPTISALAFLVSGFCFTISVGRQNNRIQEHLMKLLEDGNDLPEQVQLTLKRAKDIIAKNNMRTLSAINVISIGAMIAIAMLGAQVMMVLSIPLLIALGMGVFLFNYAAKSYFKQSAEKSIKDKIMQVAYDLTKVMIVAAVSMFSLAGLPVVGIVFLSLPFSLPLALVASGVIFSLILARTVLESKFRTKAINNIEDPITREKLDERINSNFRELKVMNIVASLMISSVAITHFYALMVAGFAAFSLWPLFLAGAVIAISILFIHQFILKRVELMKEEAIIDLRRRGLLVE